MIYFQFRVVVCWCLVVADHNIGTPSKVFDSKNKDDIDYSWYVSKKRCRRSKCRLNCAAFFTSVSKDAGPHTLLLCAMPALPFSERCRCSSDQNTRTSYS